MSQSKTITKSNSTTQVQLTSARAAEATKIYNECCKKLAEIIKTSPEQFGLSESVKLEDLMKLIPEPTFKVKSTQKKKKPKKEKLSVDSWTTATSKDQLKSLKTADLKNILSEKSLAISGNKTTLVDRVWGILHPEEAPTEVTKKKRGRPKGKKKSDTESQCTIEDSDEEQVNDKDEIQNLLETRKTIYINKNSQELTDQNDQDAEQYQLVDKKFWVFKEDEENFEFSGILKNNKLVESDPPSELMEIYGE